MQKLAVDVDKRTAIIALLNKMLTAIDVQRVAKSLGLALSSVDAMATSAPADPIPTVQR